MFEKTRMSKDFKRVRNTVQTTIPFPKKEKDGWDSERRSQGKGHFFTNQPKRHKNSFFGTQKGSKGHRRDRSKTLETFDQETKAFTTEEFECYFDDHFKQQELGTIPELIQKTVVPPIQIPSLEEVQKSRQALRIGAKAPQNGHPKNTPNLMHGVEDYFESALRSLKYDSCLIVSTFEDSNFVDFEALKNLINGLISILKDLVKGDDPDSQKITISTKMMTLILKIDKKISQILTLVDLEDLFPPTHSNRAHLCTTLVASLMRLSLILNKISSNNLLIFSEPKSEMKTTLKAALYSFIIKRFLGDSINSKVMALVFAFFVELTINNNSNFLGSLLLTFSESNFMDIAKVDQKLKFKKDWSPFLQGEIFGRTQLLTVGIANSLRFYSAESEGGVAINLKTFESFIPKMFFIPLKETFLKVRIVVSYYALSLLLDSSSEYRQASARSKECSMSLVYSIFAYLKKKESQKEKDFVNNFIFNGDLVRRLSFIHFLKNILAKKFLIEDQSCFEFFKFWLAQMSEETLARGLIEVKKRISQVFTIAKSNLSFFTQTSISRNSGLGLAHSGSSNNIRSAHGAPSQGIDLSGLNIKNQQFYGQLVLKVLLKFILELTTSITSLDERSKLKSLYSKALKTTLFLNSLIEDQNRKIEDLVTICWKWSLFSLNLTFELQNKEQRAVNRLLTLKPNNIDFQEVSAWRYSLSVSEAALKANLIHIEQFANPKESYQKMLENFGMNLIQEAIFSEISKLCKQVTRGSDPEAKESILTFIDLVKILISNSGETGYNLFFYGPVVRVMCEMLGFFENGENCFRLVSGFSEVLGLMFSHLLKAFDIDREVGLIDSDELELEVEKFELNAKLFNFGQNLRSQMLKTTYEGIRSLIRAEILSSFFERVINSEQIFQENCHISDELLVGMGVLSTIQQKIFYVKSKKKKMITDFKLKVGVAVGKIIGNMVGDKPFEDLRLVRNGSKEPYSTLEELFVVAMTDQISGPILGILNLLALNRGKNTRILMGLRLNSQTSDIELAQVEIIRAIELILPELRLFETEQKPEPDRQSSLKKEFFSSSKNNQIDENPETPEIKLSSTLSKIILQKLIPLIVSSPSSSGDQSKPTTISIFSKNLKIEPSHLPTVQNILRLCLELNLSKKTLNRVVFALLDPRTTKRDITSHGDYHHLIPITVFDLVGNDAVESNLLKIFKLRQWYFSRVSPEFRVEEDGQEDAKRMSLIFNFIRSCIGAQILLTSAKTSKWFFERNTLRSATSSYTKLYNDDNESEGYLGSADVALFFACLAEYAKMTDFQQEGDRQRRRWLVGSKSFTTQVNAIANSRYPLGILYKIDVDVDTFFEFIVKKVKDDLDNIFFCVYLLGLAKRLTLVRRRSGAKISKEKIVDYVDQMYERILGYKAVQ